MVSRTVFLSCLLLACQGISGQCTVGDSLLKKINALDADTVLSLKEKIRALPRYEAGIVGCTNHFDSTHGALLRMIGKIYSDNAEFNKAIQFFQRSRDLTTSHISHPSVKQQDLIQTYYNLAAAYGSLQRISEKIKAIDSCISVSARLKSTNAYCLWALYERAIYCYDIGDYHRCITYSRGCEALAVEYAKFRIEDAGFAQEYFEGALLWNVNSLLVLKKFDEAQKMLEKKESEAKQEGFKKNEGVVVTLMAEVLQHKGKYDEALKYHKRALELERLNNHQFNYKAILNHIGYEVYFKHYKNFDKALEYYKAALNCKVTAKDDQVVSSLESMNIFNRIGNLYSSRGQYDSAFKYIQYAFDQVKAGISEEQFLQIPLDEFISNKRLGYIATLIVDKAETFHQRYDSTRDKRFIIEAVRVYKVADQFLERIKTEQSDPKSKLFWRNDRRRLYERAIDACYAYGNMNDAFYFFERSRAVLLYDQLNEQRLLSKEDIAKQSDLKKKVSELEKELSIPDKTSGRTKDLQEQRITVQQELDQLNKGLKTKNPLYYQSFLEVNSDLLRDIQGYLQKAGGKLIEFYDGDSSSYSMIITPQEILLDKLDKNAFDSAVNKFVGYLSSRIRMNNDFPGFVKVSRDLHRLLFAKHDLQNGKIIISPDSRYFPIEALITNDQEGQLSYFVESHPVSYAHSARFLLIDFNSEKETASGSFMGLAPVNFQASMRQPSLIGSDKSLQVLKANFRKGEVKLFAEASKRNFLAHFGDYSIIQLYTHAADKRGRGEPEIFFADSVLYLSELINEKSQAQAWLCFLLVKLEPDNGLEAKGYSVLTGALPHLEFLPQSRIYGQ